MSGACGITGVVVHPVSRPLWTTDVSAAWDQPGRRTRPVTARHVLAAADQHTGVVLASNDVDTKTNEITRFAALLEDLDDLRDAVVTADALHCQREHVAYLAQRGAHWILTVKGNQCATRHSDTSPPQAGQTRREVCWV